MRKVIDSPFAEGKARLHKEEATATYRKEVFSYVRYFYVCETTGMEFSNTETDEAGIQQIYEQYRKRHSVPSPKEISELRHRYGVSAVKMSRILCLGENQYGLYEKGEMPSLSIARLITGIFNPDFFKLCLEISDLDPKDKIKVAKSIG